MAVQDRKTSIYLSLKVILLINRLKSRVSLFPTKQSLLGSESCLTTDAKALRSLQKGLGRVHPRGDIQLQACSKRIRKNRKVHRGLSRRPTCGGHRVQYVMQSLDSDLNISPRHSLSAVCSDDELFLLKCQPSFEACSMNETIQALLVVYAAINVLYAARTQYDDNFIIAQGADIGLNINETFIANYEHLLLRLQSQLVDALTRKVIEALILNDLDKTQRKLLNWFSEFPGCQRPLSTTWPWSIKPSLAVLWGVCWMFMYDWQHSQHRNNRIPQARLLQNEQVASAWPVPQANECGVGGLGPSPTHIQQSYNHAQAFPSQHAGNTSNDLTSDFSGIATQDIIIAFPQHQLELDSVAQAWLDEYAHQNLPHRSGHMINDNPTITVTQPHSHLRNQYHQQQQHQQPQHRALHLDTQFPSFEAQNYAMATPPNIGASPHQNSSMRHDPTSPLPSNMPTPVSIAATRSPLISPVLDDRRHSIASSNEPLPPQSESGSSFDGDDQELSSKRSIHAYQRPGSPPKNENGKMYCKYKECSNITFDRKCEWSKHMDKHDRPYKCKASGCEKLRGFTYSGGLLRHEREVHKLHGGTKKPLFCPIDTCKRSTGPCFTRKENLQEHIRRVHRRNSTSSDLGGIVVPGESQDDAANGLDASSKSAFRGVNSSEYLDAESGAKRKRGVAGGGGAEDGQAYLLEENKRLKRENESLRARLRQALESVQR